MNTSSYGTGLHRFLGDRTPRHRRASDTIIGKSTFLKHALFIALSKKAYCDCDEKGCRTVFQFVKATDDDLPYNAPSRHILKGRLPNPDVVQASLLTEIAGDSGRKRERRALASCHRGQWSEILPPQ